MKCQFGYRKVRYRGIAKHGAQVCSLLALASPQDACVRMTPDGAARGPVRHQLERWHLLPRHALSWS